MKTNQVMTRKMGEFDVFQRTSDGMFNATSLLKQWNEESGQQKQIVHYSENNSTNEFIEALILDADLKERNSVLMQNRGKNGGTWMHPLLFIDFAMWLNPRFKVKVLKFVYDEMIKYRNEAGDAYKEPAIAVGKLVSKEFMPIAMKRIGIAINYIVFDHHESGLRNMHGNEYEQRELCNVERKITDLINEGFIDNYDSLITYLKNLYIHTRTSKASKI